MENKTEIMQIFNELIEEYRIAEETIIDVMGNMDHSDLNKKLNGYHEKIEKALERNTRQVVSAKDQ